MPQRTTVTGGLLVTDADTFRADLVIEDGLIVALVHDGSGIDADEQVDATGMLVLPGGIDPRVTCLEPGASAADDLGALGESAAAGGITTVFATPAASPATVTASALRVRLASISREAIVDTGLWAGLSGRNAYTDRDYVSMASIGAIGFAAHLDSSVPAMPRLADADLLEAMRAIAGLNLPFSVHCEHDAQIDGAFGRMRRAKRADPLAHLESRPPIAEAAAINGVLFLAEQTGCWVHIPQVTTAESVRLITEARGRNVRVTAETSPHYLVLNEDNATSLAGFGRVAPPLRSQDDVDHLWAAVLDETIDVISSDHVPSTVGAKGAGDEDIFAAPVGMPGVQTLMPVFWDEAVNKRGMSRRQFVRQTSGNAAQMFGIAPRKGTMRIGADADLVLFDPDATWTLSADTLAQPDSWTPFDGRAVRGRVLRTIRRGVTVFDVSVVEGATPSPRGTGRFVTRVDTVDTAGGD